MSIKIIVEGETPIAALADLAVAARYLLHSDEVAEAADNVMEVDKKDIKPASQRETPPVTLDVGRAPTYSHYASASGAASTPGSGFAPGQNPPHNSAPPAASPVPQPGNAAGGYPGNSQSQSPNGGYGYNNMNQPGNNQGGGYPNNGNGAYPGNGYTQNQASGVPGVAQGNPTAGASGSNPATTTQTSLFNNQSAVHPGPGAVPVTSAPTFTVEQVGKAGADLVTANPARRNELSALLQCYGVQSVSELRPEQLAPFAQALRGLGANI